MGVPVNTANPTALSPRPASLPTNPAFPASHCNKTAPSCFLCLTQLMRTSIHCGLPMRKVGFIVLAACCLWGCETTTTTKMREQMPSHLPTIQVPLFTVGLQGYPVKFKDNFVQNASNDQTQRW